MESVKVNLYTVSTLHKDVSCLGRDAKCSWVPLENGVTDSYFLNIELTTQIIKGDTSGLL